MIDSNTCREDMKRSPTPHNLGLDSAFPTLDHNGNNLIMREPGLTKRELFAMAAMQNLCTWPYQKNDETHAANVAIKYADALLKELAK